MTRQDDSHAAIDRLRDLAGVEHTMDQVLHEARECIRALRPAGVGALRITCADETEAEVVDAFQRGFSKPMLPGLKFAAHAPLRGANLGGRYEFGAGPLAEDHFATPATADGFKVMLVKINSHVSELTDAGRLLWGEMERYDRPSACCGALDAMLAGADRPAIAELAETFAGDGLDRVALLREHEADRMLRAALVQSRLQARRCAVDVQEHPCATPTLWLILPCVTVNRPGLDGEIPVGLYVLDRCGGATDGRDTWSGLGDDPSALEITVEHGRVRVTDPGVGTVRPARDHRALVVERWRESGAHGRPDAARVDEIAADAERARGRGPGYAKVALKLLLVALAEAAPTPAAVILFGEGVLAAHHLHRAHRLARRMDEDAEARALLLDLHDRVDDLPAERAEAAVETLLRDLRA